MIGNRGVIQNTSRSETLLFWPIATFITVSMA